MSAKKPPKGELPADWFCENQTSLLDLLNYVTDAIEKEHSDDAHADPR